MNIRLLYNCDLGNYGDIVNQSDAIAEMYVAAGLAEYIYTVKE